MISQAQEKPVMYVTFRSLQNPLCCNVFTKMLISSLNNCNFFPCMVVCGHLRYTTDAKNCQNSALLTFITVTV